MYVCVCDTCDLTCYTEVATFEGKSSEAPFELKRKPVC